VGASRPSSSARLPRRGAGSISYPLTCWRCVGPVWCPASNLFHDASAGPPVDPVALFVVVLGLAGTIVAAYQVIANQSMVA
jgi:hypothetical protein